MSKALHYVLSFVFIGFLPIWIFVISPELLKLSADYSDKANMIHTENNRFDQNTDWVGKTIAISSSNLHTVNSNSVQSDIATQFKVESLTGESLFELNQSFAVNRTTRHNLAGGNDTVGKASILFSADLSKNNTVYWPIEMGAPTELSFVKTKVVNKMNTFHFQAVNSIIDDTTGYDFLPLVPEKYRVHSFVNIDIYVEPITGTIIDYQDSGTSSYVDDKGKIIWDISQWSNKYNEPTISDRVTEANKKIQQYSIVTLAVPISSALLGFLFLILGIYKDSKKKH